jgi:hypothetical protein
LVGSSVLHALECKIEFVLTIGGQKIQKKFKKVLNSLLTYTLVYQLCKRRICRTNNQQIQVAGKAAGSSGSRSYMSSAQTQINQNSVQ